MTRGTAASILGAALAIGLAPAATASTNVSSDGNRVTITGDGAADAVSVERSTIGAGPAQQTALRVRNSAGVVPGAGCSPESATAVNCALDEEGEIVATLAGGADRYEGFGYRGAQVDGGTGNDILGPADGVLSGGDNDDRLIGGFGDSGVRLSGGGGTDHASSGSDFDSFVSIGVPGTSQYGTRVDGDVERVSGTSGEDAFSIGSGAHPRLVIDGGPGGDSVSYSAISTGVRASLDGVANDGPSGRQALGVSPSDIVDLTGGSGGDQLSGNGSANQLTGGGGNDTLVAGEGDDDLTGADGADALNAGGGADTLFAGSGNDVLDGGAGPDTLVGGPGGDGIVGGPDRDQLSYADTFAGVAISLDGRPNDGSAGEGDNVGGDIEELFGGDGDDSITGNEADQEISGGYGDDAIDGGAGADKIQGGNGRDRIGGGAGPDDLRGGAGADTIDGGPGEDFVLGQERDDFGFDGDQTASGDLDVLELRDGERDTAACPTGLARVFADDIDIVATNCPAIERATPAAAAATPAPLLKVQRRGIRVDRRGVARLRVSCAKGPTPCNGVLRLVAVRRKKPLIVATSVFAQPSGTTRTLRVRLNKRGRSLLRARKVLRVEVTIAARQRGAAQTKVQTLRLRPRRR